MRNTTPIAALVAGAMVGSVAPAGEPLVDVYIVEDSGFFGVPGIDAGTIGRFSTADPSQVTVLGSAGGHQGPFNWGGLGFRSGSSQLHGFENTTNSMRLIDPKAGENVLIDSVGYIESGSFISGFAISNDGTIGYAAGTVGFQGRIVQADMETGEVLGVHAFNNFSSLGSVAVVPEGASLPYEAGTLFALRNISGGVQLVRLDLETNTATSHGAVTGIGFSAAFESGLDFAPDGTLYAAINGFSGPSDVSTRLFTIDPATATATLRGVIGNDGEWDVAGIAIVPAGQPGDFNNDGAVDVLDLLILLSAWGGCPGPGACEADLDGSGTVDVQDLLILLVNWG